MKHVRYFLRRLSFSAAWWLWNVIDRDPVTFLVEDLPGGRAFWSAVGRWMDWSYCDGDGYAWGSRLGTY